MVRRRHSAVVLGISRVGIRLSAARGLGSHRRRRRNCIQIGKPLRRGRVGDRCRRCVGNALRLSRLGRVLLGRLLPTVRGACSRQRHRQHTCPDTLPSEHHPLLFPLSRARSPFFCQAVLLRGCCLLRLSVAPFGCTPALCLVRRLADAGCCTGLRPMAKRRPMFHVA